MYVCSASLLPQITLLRFRTSMYRAQKVLTLSSCGSGILCLSWSSVAPRSRRITSILNQLLFLSTNILDFGTWLSELSLNHLFSHNNLDLLKLTWRGPMFFSCLELYNCSIKYILRSSHVLRTRNFTKSHENIRWFSVFSLVNKTLWLYLENNNAYTSCWSIPCLFQIPI